jgi:polyisoprenoid-binding protein YceI
MIRHRLSVFSPGTLVFLAAFAGAAATPAAAADSYQVDPIHSVIIFRIKHMDVGMFYGRFNGPQGSFKFDEQDPTKSSFQVSVKAQDFDSGNAKRDQHVRGPDFLNAKEFANITFKSKSVKPAQGENKFEVSGDLTMHGQTKPITAVLERIGAAGNRMGFEGVFEVKRSDFGIKGVQGVGDEVRLIVAFQGVKQ